MNAKGEVITVRLFNKNYTIRCASNEVEALYASVRELNEYFNKLDKQRNQHSRDELVMLAALNFVGQLGQERMKKKSMSTESLDRMYALQQKIEETLADES
jgi:cell division protein ZapA